MILKMLENTDNKEIWINKAFWKIDLKKNIEEYNF